MKAHLVAVAAALTLSGCSKTAAPAADAGGAKAAVAVEETVATKKTIRNLLNVSGSFISAQGTFARLTPAVPGRIKLVYVHEGDRVHKGQLLATLDTSVQAAQHSSALAAQRAAQTQASQSQMAYQAASADQQSAVRSAEIALEQAKMQRESDVTQAALGYESAQADLAKTRAGARPQEKAQAREATIQAQAAEQRAASEFKRNQELWPQGYVSRRQLDDAETAYATARSALAAARAAESLIRAGARLEDLRAAEARTAAARAALASARTLGTQRIVAAEAALRQARQGVLSVSAKQKEAEATQQLAFQKASDAAASAATTGLSEIRAPFDGRISRRILNPGDFADTTAPLLEIAATSGATEFLASVLPSQAAQVRPGMSATIDVGAKTVDGRVTSVSVADSQTGLSTIRIAAGNGAAAGAFSTAHIVLSTLPSAVAVPDSTILNRDGKTVVYKDVDGTAKQTDVQAGPSDGGFTAILSGVKPGEKIVQLGGYELDDGSKITAAAPKEPGS